jgi:hypothetical protein
VKVEIVDVLVGADCPAGIESLAHCLPIAFATSSIADELHVLEAFLNGLVTFLRHILVSLSYHVIE